MGVQRRSEEGPVGGQGPEQTRCQHQLVAGGRKAQTQDWEGRTPGSLATKSDIDHLVHCTGRD